MMGMKMRYVRRESREIPVKIGPNMFAKGKNCARDGHSWGNPRMLGPAL